MIKLLTDKVEEMNTSAIINQVKPGVFNQYNRQENRQNLIPKTPLETSNRLTHSILNQHKGNFYKQDSSNTNNDHSSNFKDWRNSHFSAIIYTIIYHNIVIFNLGSKTTVTTYISLVFL